jgi:hypothetical protein
MLSLSRWVFEDSLKINFAFLARAKILPYIGSEIIGTLLGKDEIGKMKDEGGGGKVKSKKSGTVAFLVKLMKSRWKTA